MLDPLTATLYAVAVLAGVLIGSVSPPLVISRSLMFALTLLLSILV